MAEWQTQQTQNLPTINRVGSSPTSPTKTKIEYHLQRTDNRFAQLVADGIFFMTPAYTGLFFFPVDYPLKVRNISYL